MNKKLFIQIATPIFAALACSAAVYFTMAKTQEDEAKETALENLSLNED
jgi:uncharacterized protein YpmB